MEEIKETIKEINKEFCQLVGINPICGIIINTDTKEIRKYKVKSSLYRRPKNWQNCIALKFKQPIYPDFSLPENFVLLMELNWQMFGTIGEQYQNYNESFVYNYLDNRVKAIRMIQSYGGSETVDLYIKEVQNLKYVYLINYEQKLVKF